MSEKFIKVGDYKGSCTDKEYKAGWSNILSTNAGSVLPVSREVSGVGGVSVGRVQFDDIEVTKYEDRATPRIWLANKEGTTINEIQIAFCKAAGGHKVKYFECKLSGCRISSHYLFDSDNHSLMMERFTISPDKIELTHVEQNRADGSPGGNVPAGWDRLQNKKC